jgi:hypothetical protein
MPPTPRVFPKNAIMEWNNNKVTDHNRSELNVSVERIENVKRMANGTMRKYVIADKRSFKVSWSDLPHLTPYTVDGFWGGRDIESFYNTTVGSFALKITEGDGVQTIVNVMMTDFDKTITKRGLYDFWDINVEMEEV